MVEESAAVIDNAGMSSQRIGWPIKIGIALALAAAFAAFVAYQRSAVEKDEAAAYDVAHARKVAAPFLAKYGIESIGERGTVAKENGGLVFDGTGKDSSGKAKYLRVHFRSRMSGDKVQVGISGISIDGQYVHGGPD
jgi:hypothetical protein